MVAPRARARRASKAMSGGSIIRCHCTGNDVHISSRCGVCISKAISLRRACLPRKRLPRLPHLNDTFMLKRRCRGLS